MGDDETILLPAADHHVYLATTAAQRRAAGDQLQRIDQLSKKQLTCTLCGKSFVKKTNLKHHLMLHRYRIFTKKINFSYFKDKQIRCKLTY